MELRLEVRTRVDVSRDQHEIQVVSVRSAGVAFKVIQSPDTSRYSGPAHYIKESTLTALGVDGPEVNLELSTVLGQKTITSKRVTGLTVRGVNETTEIILPRTYTRNVIPARRSQIPRHDTALKWPHLESMGSHLMPLDTEAEVGLLIGANCARAIKPHEVILGNDADPYAKKTALFYFFKFFFNLFVIYLFLFQLLT